MADEIPADIRAAAEAVVERGYNEGLLDAVARAILDERQRCIDLAEIEMKINAHGMPVQLANRVLAVIRGDGNG